MYKEDINSHENIFTSIYENEIWGKTENNNYKGKEIEMLNGPPPPPPVGYLGRARSEYPAPSSTPTTTNPTPTNPTTTTHPHPTTGLSITDLTLTTHPYRCDFKTCQNPWFQGFRHDHEFRDHQLLHRCQWLIRCGSGSTVHYEHCSFLPKNEGELAAHVEEHLSNDAFPMVM